MNNLIPHSFIEVLGGLTTFFALLLGLTSLIPSLRSHAIRLLALFFVASLSLFSNHWTTYFAGLFVIATAVTELEFLQNLAAIIRGNKHYFDYKKESLSTDQKQKKIEEEQEQLLISNEEIPGQEEEQLPISSEEIPGQEEIATSETKMRAIKFAKKSVRPTMRMLLDIEEKALDKMEEYYGSKIERGVRFSRRGKRIELDGLIPSVVDNIISDKIFEVKYLRSPRYISAFRHMLGTMEHLAHRYYEITNKIAKLHIVLVVEGEEGLNEKQLSNIKQMIDSSDTAMAYSVFTTKDLGVN